MTLLNLFKAKIFVMIFICISHLDFSLSAKAIGNSFGTEDKRNNNIGTEPSFSLFFTPQELKEMTSNPEHSLTVSNTSSPVPPLCLHALFYTASNSWCVWINGQAVTSSQPYPNLKILEISSESVLFEGHFLKSWRQFSLMPHQCYDPNQQKITELIF